MSHDKATPTKRRHSLLASLYFEDHGTARVHTLVGKMERVHNIAISADLVRADLAWLAEMELVQLTGDAAQVTERGRDVVNGRAAFPGLG